MHQIHIFLDQSVHEEVNQFRVNSILSDSTHPAHTEQKKSDSWEISKFGSFKNSSQVVLVLFFGDNQTENNKNFSFIHSFIK